MTDETTQTTDTSSMQEQLIKEAVNAFKKEFTKTRAGEIVWLRGIMPGEIEEFLTKQFSTIASKSGEWAVKITISQFLKMNIENPAKPVNIDEVKRRAMEALFTEEQQ